MLEYSCTPCIRFGVAQDIPIQAPLLSKASRTCLFISVEAPIFRVTFNFALVLLVQEKRGSKNGVIY